MYGISETLPSRFEREEDAWTRTTQGLALGVRACMHLEGLHFNLFWFHLGFPFYINLTEFHGDEVS